MYNTLFACIHYCITQKGGNFMHRRKKRRNFIFFGFLGVMAILPLIATLQKKRYRRSFYVFPVRHIGKFYRHRDVV